MSFRRRTDSVATALEAAGLSAKDARRLSLAGTAISVGPGVSLCTEGNFGAEAFVLLSGEAVVRFRGEDITRGAGAVIGEIAALDPMQRRNATVETTTNSVVLAFDARTFRSLAAEMAGVLVPNRAA